VLTKTIPTAIYLQKYYVDLRILHAPDKNRDEPVEVWSQCIFAHRLFGKGEPEFTCLQGNAFIGILSAEQHVLQTKVIVVTFVEADHTLFCCIKNAMHFLT
jgi:hypothetical protein